MRGTTYGAPQDVFTILSLYPSPLQVFQSERLLIVSSLFKNSSEKTNSAEYSSNTVSGRVLTRATDVTSCTLLYEIQHVSFLLRFKQ
jgi:hypothetical protein